MSASKDKPTAESPPDFEQALAELERLIATLEQGDISLESALQHFERGVALARHCQTALRQAEQRVEQLLEDDGRLATAPYPEDDQ